MFCHLTLKHMPRVRLELTAFRLWDWRAAYCANEAWKIIFYAQLELSLLLSTVAKICPLCQQSSDSSWLVYVSWKFDLWNGTIIYHTCIQYIIYVYVDRESWACGFSKYSCIVDKCLSSVLMVNFLINNDFCCSLLHCVCDQQIVKKTSNSLCWN